ncbi:MAG: SDR family oxidoreductase, partial [Fuerstia sp.]|nr:SDR family oxidoreductase [Fuerstiella sp.]
MNSGIGFAGPMAAHTAVRKSRRFSWDQKRVLITGGSRDLGLALARQVAARGARLAICGQTVDQLDHSVREVRRYTRDAIGIEYDLRDPNSVTRTVAETEGEFGGVDVLVNVADIIAAASFDSITQADFESTMSTNCRVAFRAIQAALPLMRHQGWGRILNIASMGGQRPVPDMLPDAARETVWFGISDSLKTKLKHENILISTA